MTLTTYCFQCNSIIGHIHIPYRQMLNKHAEDIVKDPNYVNTILEFFGLTTKDLCCRNSVMSPMVDMDLEKYLKANPI